FYEMNRQTLEEKDYITQNFLQWFITEQLEEMSTSQKLLDLIRMSGDNLLMVEMMVDRLSAGQDTGGAA
ncbi:MAG: ferritin, partial [Gammaproteobacteria bacterium]|nr:ferritin [Gammaproteobacteria bacterium]